VCPYLLGSNNYKFVFTPDKTYNVDEFGFSTMQKYHHRETLRSYNANVFPSSPIVSHPDDVV
jgi:hypothetical protein